LRGVGLWDIQRLWRPTGPNLRGRFPLLVNRRELVITTFQSTN